MASTKDMIAFSERMLNEMNGKPVQHDPSISKSDVISRENFMSPDKGIKHVKVSDDYLNQIIGFNSLLESSTVKEEDATPELEDLTEAQKLQEKISSLVERLTSLLKEARTVIQEMTSTGSIGVGTQSSLMFKKNGEEYPPKALKKKKKA